MTRIFNLILQPLTPRSSGILILVAPAKMTIILNQKYLSQKFQNQESRSSSQGSTEDTVNLSVS